MNRFLFFPLLVYALLLPAACTQKQAPLPVLMETQPVQGKESACNAVFPRFSQGGKWQFVHTIDFTMNNGGGSTVVGVTALTSDSLECALLTPEGFTLFAGTLHREKGFEVSRAVPPFDKPAFAQGMLEDLRAIFREPLGRERVRGQITGASGPVPICRYTADGKVTDVLPGGDADACWRIRTYTPDKMLSRSIIAQSCRQTGPAHIPQHLELQTYGLAGYTLKMTLLTAEYLE
jgi:hypothetical protein